MEAGHETAFRALEHKNWEKAVAAYDKGWGSLTRQCIPELLAAVACAPQVRLLDVATGPGFAAEAAAALGAEAVGADFSAKMLELARQRISGSSLPVSYVEADATKLPFEDASFDAVVCNFGVLHFAAPAEFFAEAMRVLRPNGRFAFTVWAPPPATEAFECILGAVREHGNPDVTLPPGPPFFQFADAATAAEALTAHGFAEVASRTVPQVWEAPSAEDVFVAFRDGTGRTAALLAGQTPEQLKAVEAALFEALEARKVGAGPLELKMPCIMTTAVKRDMNWA